MNIIPGFPGDYPHNIAIESWLENVRGFARSRDILGITFTPEEWLQRVESGNAPYEIPRKPPCPDETASKTDMIRYNVLSNLYSAHLEASNDLRDRVIQSIANDRRSMALFPDIGTIPIHTIIERMVTEFSRWQPEALFNLNMELERSWNPTTTSIHELLNSHHNIHNILQRNGNPLSHMAKINAVMAALKESGLYESWFQNWRIAHSTTESRIYADFVRDIKLYYPTIQLQTSQMGYTANAAVTTDKTTSNPGKEPKVFFWCSTHHLNHSHWSSACRSPSQHHKPNETKPPKGWTMA